MLAQLYRSWSLFWMSFVMLADYLWLSFMERFRTEAVQRSAEQRAYARWGRRIRTTALKLHGVIIKIGQFLSARADVLPDSFTKELTTLQDAVPPAPFEPIRRRVEAELGAPLGSVFAEFEPEAIASASLGQVHRAKLADGQTVAVKVLRPGIERLVATDMAAMRRMFSFLHRHTRMGKRLDLPAIMDEFETITHQEMDYRLEAENIRHFRKDFAGFEGVDVPYPLDSLVSEKLLVMEYKAGLKLTDRERLMAWGLDPTALAARLVDTYIKQFLIDGFVHVDPHAGNLLVDQRGTLIFVDFGMMGSITAADRQGVADLTQALLIRDLEAAVRALNALGFLRRAGAHEPLKKAIGFILDRFDGTEWAPGPEFDQFLEEFREWLYEEPIQFPARYLYMARAIGLLAGMVSALDPAIDWGQILKERALPLLTMARPQAEAEGEAEEDAEPGFDWRELLAGWLGPTAPIAVDVILRQAKETGLSLVRLPGQMERALGKIESGSLHVHTDLTEVSEKLELHSRAMNRVVWALLAAGGGIAGAMLRVGGFALEARVAWGVAGVAIIGLLIGMMRGSGSSERRRRAPHPTIHKER